MKFIWMDYTAEYAALVDSWLDEQAVAMTGLDLGWDWYWQAVVADSVNYPGCKDFCKIICKDGLPFAAAVFGCYQGVATISEIVVRPEHRSKGLGTQVIGELVAYADMFLGEAVERFQAVIFPDNIPSQKAFQKAGFVLDDTHEAVWNYIYKAENTSA